MPIPGPRVVALDLSLTGTGVAIIADHQVWTTTLSPKATGHTRLELICEKVIDWCADADAILIEAAVSYAKGNNALIMGGLWWVVTHALWHESQPYVVIQPGQLKMYATGKGNSSKEAVGYEAVRRFPNVMITDNNQADALWMAHMACDWLGWPLIQLPQANRRVIDTISTWPERDAIRRFPAPNPARLAVER